MSIFENLFRGNSNVASKFSAEVDQINRLEQKYQTFSDQEIKDQIQKWKEEIKPVADEERVGQAAFTSPAEKLAARKNSILQKELDRLLPDVFALVRETARRAIGQRHFDVQLIGGITLHRGQIAEMKTGEGKTLTATLPIVLNALSGKGVHLVTVNDYLARWHASLMGPVYHKLGLSVASIQHEKSFIYDPNYEPEQEEVARLESETQGFVLDVKHMRPVSRREAYAADITYGTNNEFGFDYLRDNMVSDLSQMVQRGLNFVIVDEVDSILIDEARTPLIISAPDMDPTDKYYQFAKIAEQLEEGTHYVKDEKRKVTTLTEEGIEKIEKILGVPNIYDGPNGVVTVHHIEQALRAKGNFLRDRDYVNHNGEIVIVDEFTGRLMFGRRYSDGLHQAIEAKEGVKIQQESKTLATITFQNYFRMYTKLSGMTGTAMTESEEFYKIYGLEVVVIPTNRPMIRKDNPDSIYKSEKGKFEAIVRDVTERHKKGQPILIGTVSIQKNELLAEYLRRAGLPFELLNAKNHEREAHIISQAGRLGAITLATNIAGRGVDILLGGNPVDQDEAAKIREVGGLHVIGTERHESRRIDNQLRGRGGRQGDPGTSQFYVSVEDDLMRLFGGNRLQAIMERLGIPEDQPIEHSIVSKSIEQAQKKIEGLNFDTRKHVLEYDDIMNKQREVIYRKRRHWLAGNSSYYENDRVENGQDEIQESEDKPLTLQEEIRSFIDKEIRALVTFHFAGEEQTKTLIESVSSIFPLSAEESSQIEEFANQAGDAEFAITDYLLSLAQKKYDEKERFVAGQGAQATGQTTPDYNLMRQLEKIVALQNLDTVWMEHLDTMEHLRDSVSLRGYGQRDPLVEYKREGYDLFQRALAAIESGIVHAIYKIGIILQPPVTELQKAAANAVESGGGLAGEQRSSGSAALSADNIEKIGRNDPCPCGSGKKYKKCGMLNTVEHQQLMAKKA